MAELVLVDGMTKLDLLACQNITGEASQIKIPASMTFFRDPKLAFHCYNGVLSPDSGTATQMVDQFDQQTCVCMWGELDAEFGVKNFVELVELWFRNMDEFLTSGTVASGEFPFAVQFCSPGWLPSLKDRPTRDGTQTLLAVLRNYFCAFEDTKEGGKKIVMKKMDFYNTIASNKGRYDFMAVLKGLGFKGVR